MALARNVGIGKATGKYLALIDSDDYVEPDFIDSMVHMAERKNAEAVICNFYFNFPNGVKIPFPLMTLQKNLTGEAAAQASIKLLTMPTFAWNKLYRLELFMTKNIAYPSIYYEHLATTPRLLLQAEKGAVIIRPLYHYCLRRTGITGNFKMKNVIDYLKAVDIVRHFIWEENLWESWRRHYRLFLVTIEAHLLIALNIQKNSIPMSDRRHLSRQIHHRLRLMAAPPDKDQPEAQDMADISAKKVKKPIKPLKDRSGMKFARRIIGRLK